MIVGEIILHNICKTGFVFRRLLFNKNFLSDQNKKKKKHPPSAHRKKKNATLRSQHKVSTSFQLHNFKEQNPSSSHTALKNHIFTHWHYLLE